MNYKIRIGNAAFSICSEIYLYWSTIDELFLYSEDQETQDDIAVLLYRAEHLPFGNLNTIPGFIEVSSDRGLSIFSDGKSTEIREYQSFFYEGTPVYAQSRLDNEKLEIWLKCEDDFLRHPNFHLWNLMHMEHFLLEKQALVFHCCYMMYKGEAILFSAPSGTGKTTQGKLWEKIYGSRIINGDRGLLQRMPDGTWKVFGYPYHGSAPECENLSYPIRSIIIVRQSPVDRVESLSMMKRVAYVYSECTVNNWNQQAVQNAMDLIGDLCGKVPVCKFCCTMNSNAAKVLHEYLYADS